MHFEPDAVPEPVPELLTPAGRSDHVARGRVDFTAARSGRERLESRQLRLEAHLVGARKLVRKLAGGEGARAVGGVAIDAAAGVDGDERAGGDLDVPNVRVRARPVLGRGDDRVEAKAPTSRARGRARARARPTRARSGR